MEKYELKRNELEKKLNEYEEYLREKELAQTTVKKYVADIRRFLGFLSDRPLTKKLIISYKQWLQQNYQVSTCNSYLIALNGYFRWLKKSGFIVKLILRQRGFSVKDTITYEEYQNLLKVSKENEKIHLIIRTLACTGIRVGELPFVTYQALQTGFFVIQNKGKNRECYLSQKLRELLSDYCERHSIDKGSIFLNHRGTAPIHVSVIWRNLRKYGERACIDPRKLYPHNLRRLFARRYMEMYHNVVELADILGHSSLETTRIYTRTTRSEKAQEIGRLGL